MPEKRYYALLPGKEQGQWYTEDEFNKVQGWFDEHPEATIQEFSTYDPEQGIADDEVIVANLPGKPSQTYSKQEFEKVKGWFDEHPEANVSRGRNWRNPTQEQTAALDDFNKANEKFFAQYEDAQKKVSDPNIPEDQKTGFIQYVNSFSDDYEDLKMQHDSLEEAAYGRNPQYKAAKRLDELNAQIADLENELQAATDAYNADDAQWSFTDEDADVVRSGEAAQKSRAARERMKAAQSGLKKLYQEREENPEWKRLNNAIVAGLEERQAQMEEFGKSIRNDQQYVGTSIAGGPMYASTAPMEDQKAKTAYEAAAEMYRQAAKTMAAPSKYGKESGIQNMWMGIKENALDAVIGNLRDLGFNMELIDTIKTIQEKEGNEVSLIDLANNIDLVTYLDDAHKELLRAFIAESAASQQRSDDLSRGYQAGQSAIESLVFMGEFLATGGVGESLTGAVLGGAKEATIKAIASASAKAGLKGAARDAALAVPKFAAGTIEGLAKTAIMTPLMPSSWTNLTDNLLQMNDAGQVDLSGRALGKAVGDVFIENFSENAGGQVEAILGFPFKVGGKAIGGTKFMAKVAETPFGRWGKAMRVSPAARVLKQAGFNGFIGEVGEEWYGNALRVMTGVDKDALKDFATVDQQIITLASFAPMSLFGLGVSSAQFGAAKHHMNNAGKMLSDILYKNGYSEDQIKNILDVTKAENPTQLASMLAPVVNQVANDNGSASEVYKAVCDYAQAVAQYRVFDGYSKANVDQQRQDMRSLIDSSFPPVMNLDVEGRTGTEEAPRWYTEKKYTTSSGNEISVDTVRIITDEKHGDRYVTGEKDGMLSLIDKDGNKSIITEQEIENADNISDTGYMRMQDYLDQEIARKRDIDQTGRMEAQTREDNANLAASAMPGTQLNIGTVENPKTGTVRQVVGNTYIIESEDGVAEYSAEEVAGFLGMPFGAKTDAELDAAREASAIAHDDKAKAVAAAKGRPFVHDGTTYTAVGADYAVNIDENGAESGGSYLVQAQAPDGSLQTLSLDEDQMDALLDNLKADEAAIEADTIEGAAESAPDDGKPRDFRGNELPLRPNGQVNEQELWNRDPEAWCVWNDTANERKVVGSQERLDAAIAQVSAEAAAIETQLKNEALGGLDGQKMDQMQEALAGARRRERDLQAIRDKYYGAPDVEQQEAAQEPAQTGNEVEDTITELDDGTLTDDEIDAFIDNNIKQAKKGVDKASKLKNDETDMQAFRVRSEAIRQEQEKAQQELDKWNAVKARFQEVKQVAGTEETSPATAAEIQEIQGSKDPQNLTELAAYQLTGMKGQINREDFLHHTGWGEKEASKFRYLFAPKGKGMSLQTVAEKMDENDTFGIMHANDEYGGDVQEAFNAILDLLQETGSYRGIRDYIARRRAEQAKETEEYYRGLNEQAITDEFGVSVDEYYGLERQSMREARQKALTPEQENELNAIFAEEYERDTTNDERGVSGNSEGSQQVLQGAQPDNSERGAATQGNESAASRGGSADQDAAVSESASGELKEDLPEEAVDPDSHVAALERALASGDAVRMSSAIGDMRSFISSIDHPDLLENTIEWARKNKDANDEDTPAYGTYQIIESVCRERLAVLRDAENAISRISELTESIGVKVRVLRGINEVEDAGARQVIEGTGGTLHAVRGWFNPVTGEVEIFVPGVIKDSRLNGKDARRSAEETYLHEVVAHYGLRQLLGQERFDELCDGVYESMSEAERTRFLEYVNGVAGDTASQRAAADEYMAHIAESLDSGRELDGTQKSIWRRIVDAVASFLGWKDSTPDVERMLYESMAALRRKNTAGRESFMPNETMVGSNLYSTTDGGKKLLGIHNIASGQLSKAIGLGGLANPSTAVINAAERSFDKYGDISLLMTPKMVAADSGRHPGVFAADIYSPNFPTVYTRLSSDAQESFEEEIVSIVANDEISGRLGLVSEFLSNIEDGRSYSGLEYAFLKQKGVEKLEKYVHENFNQLWEPYVTEYADLFDFMRRFRSDEIFRKKISDLVISDMRRQYTASAKGSIRKKEGETIFEFSKRLSEDVQKFLNIFTDENGFVTENLAERKFSDQLYAYTQNGAFDAYRTKSDAGYYVSVNDLRDEYENWCKELLRRHGAQEQLFKGRDREGRPIYVDNTLRNASAIMRSQGLRAADGFFASSLGGARAQMAPVMTTLQEIRDNAFRLDSEGFEEAKEKLEERYMRLAGLFDTGDRYDFDTKYYRLQEAMMSRNPAGYARKNYRINLSEDEAREIREFADALRVMPTGYFELKFERPVYLKEFGAAVVPAGTPSDIIEALSKAGVPVYEYDGTVEGSRNSAVQSAARENGLLFSKTASTSDAASMENLRKAEEFIVRSLNGATGSFTVHLPQETLDMVRRNTGAMFESHSITANSIRHSRNNHGINGRKNNENSIPLKDSDISLAPYIMAAPSYVEPGTEDVTGRASIRFVKNISNGNVVVVEKETKNSPDDMETITMWAEKSSAVADARNNASPAVDVQNVISGSDDAKIRKDAEDAINKERTLLYSRAFHGTSEDFDRFDTSHALEGEGAMAHGFGIYVAFTEDVGRQYATRVSHYKKKASWKGNPVDTVTVNPLRLAWDVMDNHRTVREARDAAERYARLAEEKDMKQMWNEALDILRHSTKSDFGYLPMVGNRHLYTLRLPDDTGTNYLDETKVPSDELMSIIERAYENHFREIGEPQPLPTWALKYGDDTFNDFFHLELGGKVKDEEDVMSEYRSFFGKELMPINGRELYRELSNDLVPGKVNQTRMASAFLENAGVVGIKYKGIQDGPCAVIFNGDDIKIENNLRFSATGTNTAEVDKIISDAKANGTYMKAPNGKTSNLPENLWALVRTERFKAWFGDWEKVANMKNGFDALRRLANGEDVVENAMLRPELVMLGGTSGITFEWGTPGRPDSNGYIRKGSGLSKIVYKHGADDAIRIIGTIANGTIGEAYGPENGKRVDIVSERYQATISLFKDRESKSWLLTGYKLDETTDAKGRGSDLANATQSDPIRTREALVAALSSDANVRYINEITNNSSKIVDENGEPKIVFHGTEWDMMNEPAGQAVFHDQAYFSSKADIARSFGSRVNGFFLNFRNPYIFDAENNAEYTSIGEVYYAAKRKGYDSVIAYSVEDSDGTGDQYVASTPNQIKSVENNGDFSTTDPDIRYSVTNANQRIFVSNAETAVEGLNVAKASPEQWLKAIQGRGGLKAGEDKWLGLSQWLADSQAKSITKQEVLDFIRKNEIVIEEVDYTEAANPMWLQELKYEYRDFLDEANANGEEDVVAYAMERMKDEHGGDDFEMGFWGDERDLYADEDSDFFKYFAEQYGGRPISSVRLDYSTRGLENKREIALTVPTIEPWNEEDDVHFGDADGGRAIAWIRFGDAVVRKPIPAVVPTREELAEFERLEKVAKDAEDKVSEELDKGDVTKETADAYNKAVAERDEYQRILNAKTKRADVQIQKVLFIDEIQSKRHQEGREKGYAQSLDNAKMGDFYEEPKYGYTMADVTAENGRVIAHIYKTVDGQYFGESMDGSQMTSDRDTIDDVMKGLKSFASFNGVPDAPFEKNWHELAFKRMLRLAAEEGYDIVAWTTGEQQADRYDLSTSVDEIRVIDAGMGEHEIRGFKDGENVLNKTVTDGEKGLAAYIGKDMARKAYATLHEGDQTYLVNDTYAAFKGDDLRIGGEGMKGFYDDILPRFVNKYGKKWGASTKDTRVVLSNGSTLDAHSVDVTPEMKQSVMSGQPMFSITGIVGAKRADEAMNSTTRIDNLNFASEMESAGYSALDIKLATGWERGADGKWRLEEPDVRIRQEWFDTIKAASDEERKNMVFGISEICEDDEALKLFLTEYPELADVKIKPYNDSFFDIFNTTRGYYNDTTNTLMLNFEPVFLGEDVTIEDLESVMVHEFQHVIQSAEGFARGGNTNAVESDEIKSLEEKRNAVEDKKKVLMKKLLDNEEYKAIEKAYDESLKSKESDEYKEWKSRQPYYINQEVSRKHRQWQLEMEPLWDESRKARAEYEKLRHNPFRRKVRAEAKARLDDITNRLAEGKKREPRYVHDSGLTLFRGKMFRDKTAEERAETGRLAAEWSRVRSALLDNSEEYQALKKQESKLGDDIRTARYNAYRALAGEVEARAAANRIALTDTQRRERLIVDDEDIARESQVVIFGDQTSSNILFSITSLDSMAEREYRETGAFSFTGKERIENTDDVAFIFRELENAATENSFVVFVKNGVPTVLHTGIGGITSTTIDMTSVVAGYKDFAPDTVYMVHNHPSGNLVASRADKEMLQSIQDIMPGVGVEGIIIDTVSGQYGLFDKWLDTTRELPEGEEGYPITVKSFDRIVFAPEYKAELGARKVVGPESVAAFLSAHRLGEGDKLGALLLNTNSIINANLVTNENSLTADNASVLAGEIVDAAVRCGATQAILFGRFDFNNDSLKAFNDEFAKRSAKSIRLTDVVQIEDGNVFSIADGTLNERRGSIRYSITAQQDAEYMDAVEKGDMEKAQRMVRDAFKAVFPNTKVVDGNGNPIVVYHGAMARFNVFDREMSDSTNEFGKGMYFSDSKLLADRYASLDHNPDYDNEWRVLERFEELGKEMGLDLGYEDTMNNEYIGLYNQAYDEVAKEAQVVAAYINIENPFVQKDEEIREDTNLSNHDGVIDEAFAERHPELGGTQYVVFTPSQIKSAEPVTYDDSGNVIPLSQRFNPESNDIRFSISGESPLAQEEAAVRYSIVNDPMEIARLEGEDYITVYQSAVKIDGQYYSPMNTLSEEDEEGRPQLGAPIQFGRWVKADEHPERIVKEGPYAGKYPLKEPGKTPTYVAYNPYLHTTASPLNDQFTAAHRKPLVVLEVRVPKSELTSGYHAEGAKDSTGEMSWHSGPVSAELAEQGKERKVILTRWAKPMREVPASEIAGRIAEMLDGTGISIPINVVTEELRGELEQRGVKFGPIKGTVGADARRRLEAELDRMNGTVRDRRREREFHDQNRRRGESALHYAKRVVDYLKSIYPSNVELVVKRSENGTEAEYSPAENKITIFAKPAWTYEQVRDSYLHEHIHAAIRNMGIDVDWLDDKIKGLLDQTSGKGTYEAGRREFEDRFNYDKDEQKEEFLAYLISKFIRGRDVVESIRRYDELLADNINEIFNTFGYNGRNERFRGDQGGVQGNAERSPLDSQDTQMRNNGAPQEGGQEGSQETALDEDPDASEIVSPVAYSSSISGKRYAAESTANALGVEVSIVSRDEMPARHQNSAGVWRDGRILVCLDNNLDAEDVTKTVLHEAVGHNGLRRLVGDANMSEFCYRVYELLPERERQIVAQNQIYRYGGNLEQAVEEYLAGEAENFDYRNTDINELLVRLRATLRNLLYKVGINVNLSRRDVRWLLWQSYNANRQGDLINEAQRAVLAQRLGFSLAASNAQARANGLIRDRLVEESYAQSAANMYNRQVMSAWGRLRESFVDMNQAVDKLVAAIETVSGKAAKAFEDVRKALNRMSRRNLADMKKWERSFYTPMMDAVKECMAKAGCGQKDIERYVMLKHGLERNEKLAKRDAREFYTNIFETAREQIMKNDSLDDAAKKAKIDKEQKKLDKHLADIDAGADAKYKELREDDYSGIMSMFATYDDYEPKRAGESEEKFLERMKAARHLDYDNLADAEAAAAKEVAEWEGKFGQDATDNLWEKVNAATKDTLRHQYESNMISREQYDHVRNMFDYYVPLRGFDETTAEDMYDYYMKGQTNTFTPPLLNAKGRKTVAESPFGYIGFAASSAIAADGKNNAKLSLYYFVNNRPGNDLVTISDVWYEKDGEESDGSPRFKAVYPDITEDLSADEVKQRLQDFEDNMRQKAEAGLAFKGHKNLRLSSGIVHIDDSQVPSHIIRVKVGGEDKLLFINGNPRAAQAINGELNFDAKQNDVEKTLTSALRWLASVNTSFNPEFWFSNFQRDVLLAMMSESTEGNTREFAKNFARAMKVFTMKGKYEEGTLGDTDLERYYSEFVDNGGVTGFTTVRQLDEWEKGMKDYLKEDTKMRQAVKAIKNGLEKIEDIGEKVEQMTRFAAFITAREQGKSITDAVDKATELTVNFNRKGSGRMIPYKEALRLYGRDGKRLNKAEAMIFSAMSAVAPYGRSTIMFFNAAVQGIKKMVDLYRANPRKMAAWTAAYFALGVVNAVLHAMFDDDDDYLDMPDYERRTNLLLGGNGFYIKWALPQEMRMFYGMGDIAVSHIMGRQPNKSAAGEMANMVLDISPINPAGGLNSVLPSYFVPFIEAGLPFGWGWEGTNRNFMGARIYNDNRFASEGERERTPGYKKALPGTGAGYVDFAEFMNRIGNPYPEYDKGIININPGRLEHYVESFTGGTGTTIEKMFQFGRSVFTDEPWMMRNTPMLRRLAVMNDERSRNSHTTELYYWYRDEAEHVIQNEKKMLKDRDAESLARLRQSDDYRMAQIYNAYAKTLKPLDDMLKETDDQSQRRIILQQQDAIRKDMIKQISYIK